LAIFAALAPAAHAQSNVTIQNQTYAGGTTLIVQATNSLSASLAVAVASSANITYRAGTRVVLGPGFTAFSGSNFHVEIVAPPGTDVTAPTTPASLHVVTTTSTTVSIAWTASTDNVGVAGYAIYRNGALVATVGVPSVTYTDSGLSLATTYTYTVKAFDAAGNYSAASNSVQGTTLNTATQVDTTNQTQLKIHIP
jgi:hypothetical protein